MVPYSAAQAAMALKKAKKESLAEAVKLAASTAAAAAKLASSKTQIKGKCFCKVDVEGSSQIILSMPNLERTYSSKKLKKTQNEHLIIVCQNFNSQ